ncbi:hypothetical protein [Streptomyces sp. NBC_00038]|uniref:hypothetical protein n=1 Tax=Streptomyces sp. NBC_00038 TaxID=2903615 RepID=UPI00225BE40A|nr:hypothetical protein [Streptomyces sp. NBC_00038]MCX5555782.1 hypothetical protein [Streptomyces sp. NBC_00038]
MGVTGEHGTPGASGQPHTIRVDVGELVLDGFGVDPERVSASFERELTRLVRERGVPIAADGGLSLDTLSALPPMPAGLSARRLGQELARAVHAGLSGRGEVTR